MMKTRQPPTKAVFLGDREASVSTLISQLEAARADLTRELDQQPKESFGFGGLGRDLVASSPWQLVDAQDRRTAKELSSRQKVRLPSSVSAFVIVFSLESRESFEYARRIFRALTKRRVHSGALALLVGHENDYGSVGVADSTWQSRAVFSQEAIQTVDERRNSCYHEVPAGAKRSVSLRSLAFRLIAIRAAKLFAQSDSLFNKAKLAFRPSCIAAPDALTKEPMLRVHSGHWVENGGDARYFEQFLATDEQGDQWEAANAEDGGMGYECARTADVESDVDWESLPSFSNSCQGDSSLCTSEMSVTSDSLLSCPANNALWFVPVHESPQAREPLRFVHDALDEVAGFSPRKPLGNSQARVVQTNDCELRSESPKEIVGTSFESGLLNSEQRETPC